MKKALFYLLVISLSVFGFVLHVEGKKPSKNGSYYELKVYHFSNSQQERVLENFIQNELMPHLHNSGISNIGVFKAIANDTATDKRMYVLIPFNSLKQWEKFLIRTRANDPAVYSSNEYTNVTNDKPAYSRMETIFLHAFKLMPEIAVPKLNTPKIERVYELRSYESVNEKVHENKVHMFNEGGEMGIFTRLGFNAVFYGQVVHGAKMPNLMYMTSFDNMKTRDEHWNSFRSDPEWKTLSAKPEYQKNVSKSEIMFLRPTDYSDL